MNYDKASGRFVRKIVRGKTYDYTRCLNCGTKEKEVKWIKTHFCSLKCFGEYNKHESRRHKLDINI